jgi:hypothetical protein
MRFRASHLGGRFLDATTSGPTHARMYQERVAVEAVTLRLHFDNAQVVTKRLFSILRKNHKIARDTTGA